MNPRDPLWYLPTRPRVANLIDELPDDFGDYAASQQVRGYLQRLCEHGIEGPNHGDPVANLEHALTVIAGAVREGDLDAVRMHYEHVMGKAPDLAVEVAQ